MDTVRALRRLIEAKNFGVLRERLLDCDIPALIEVWREFKPLEKLVIFKLFPPKRAFDFYSILDLNAKYFLLCAFDLESIAPVIRGLPQKEKSAFQQLPDSYYDRMLRLLASEQVEIEVAVRTN